MILLQFVIERGLGLDLGAEMQRRVFDRLRHDRHQHDVAAGLRRRTSPTAGAPTAASSRTTNAARCARPARWTRRSPTWRDCAAGIRPWRRPVRAGSARAGEAATADHHRQPVPLAAAANCRPTSAAGSGRRPGRGRVRRPAGPGFFKGGHNDSTGNTWVCVRTRPPLRGDPGQRCARGGGVPAAGRVSCWATPACRGRGSTAR